MHVPASNSNANKARALLLGIGPDAHGSTHPAPEVIIEFTFTQVKSFLGSDALASTFDAHSTFENMIGTRTGTCVHKNLKVAVFFLASATQAHCL